MKEERKRERKLLSNRAGIKTKRRLSLRQRTFAKLLPISKDATQAAIDAGYSERSARQIGHDNLTKTAVVLLVEKNMKQAMNDSGLTNQNLADKFHELIFYNTEKVIRVVGEGDNAREVEEMRDARVAASTLANVVKFKGASLENTSAGIINEVNSETAWLAIKSLVRKLSVDQVKELRDSCDAMLESKVQIVAEA
jgi:phage terminase small subunit